MEQTSSEAAENAIKYVASLLRRPDELDLLDRHFRTALRKKTTLESRLKAAVQTQLDDAQQGLGTLQSTVDDVQSIRDSFLDIDNLYGKCIAVDSKLIDIKLITSQHLQLSAAKDHLNYIFALPESIERTQALINDGRLLEAHKRLVELERARDELLFEVHKLPEHTELDKQVIMDYFSKIAPLSTKLSKQLWVVLQRALNIVRTESALLVTALRIIEREERSDRKAVEKEKDSGFCPPDRPKCYRKKALEVLEKSVRDRFEFHQAEMREENSTWLIKFLEQTRKSMIEDLIVVKKYCIPAFPASYNILQLYVKLYHNELSSTLNSLSHEQLKANDIASLLTWSKKYSGAEFMMHPSLEIDVSHLGPLINSMAEDVLLKKYTSTMRANIKEWMSNLLKADMKDWTSSKMPISDAENCLQTTLPIDLYQMLDQNVRNLSVASVPGQNVKLKALHVCMLESSTFLYDYRAAVNNYRDRHMEERTEPPNYVYYMISIVNNCNIIDTLSDGLLERVNDEFGKGWHSSDTETLKLFDTNKDLLFRLSLLTIDYLIDEVFYDLESHFNGLLTRKWLTSSTAMDTIIVTIEDYGADFKYLRKMYYNQLMARMVKRLIKEYVTAIVHKRIVFKQYDERRQGAEKIGKEANDIERLFTKSLSDSNDFCWKVLHSLADVIKLKDTTMLCLEIRGLVMSFPDIRTEHIQALLALRGDLKNSDIKQIIQDSDLDSRGSTNTGETGIFKDIVVPSLSLFGK
ncbi:Exocyst complex component 3 [Trichoplax sp. H2]|nr:Exocyst complex component 3 [Trichoplax sp. H2]|eukprot:RDD36949.1 Exocyst complex component 3 [Trichoplax sp. H2]